MRWWTRERWRDGEGRVRGRRRRRRLDELAEDDGSGVLSRGVDDEGLFHPFDLLLCRSSGRCWSWCAAEEQLVEEQIDEEEEKGKVACA